MMIFHDVSLQCSNGKGRAQWGVEILQCFIIFIHWGWNGVQFLTQTHVNLYSSEGCQLVRQICRRAMTKWGTNASMASGDFPVFQDETVAGLHCPRGGFIVRTSTNAWLKDWALLVPSYIFFSTYFIVQASAPCFRRCRKPWVETAMEN